MHGEELFEAAPGPKRMSVFPGVGHNDFIARAGDELGGRDREFAAG